MGATQYGHRRRTNYLDSAVTPELLAGILLARQFGNDWYVNSAAASGGDGRSASSALLTVQLAVNAASAGDRIFVAPGHAETVTSSSLTLSKAGVTIICTGNGLNQPTFTFSTAAATINVTAANVTWVGGYFLANFLDVASAFTIAAAKDFRIDGALFNGGSAVLNFLSIVTTGATNNAADGLTVTNCVWVNLNTTPLAFVSVLGNLDRLLIAGNFVNSASTDNVGHFLTIAAMVILAARVYGNTLVVVGATNATVGIFLTGSSTTNTGIVADNRISSLDTTTELLFTTGTGLVFFDNYYTGVADKSGYILPAIDSAA